MTAAVNWGALMRAGIQGHGLLPRDFWALTPAELLLMLGCGGADAPLGRARLNELAAQFPDRPANTPPDRAATNKETGHGSD